MQSRHVLRMTIEVHRSTEWPFCHIGLDTENVDAMINYDLPASSIHIGVIDLTDVQITGIVINLTDVQTTELFTQLC